MSTQATWLAEYAAQVRLGTGVFWSRLKRWFLAAAAVGAIAGLAVAAVGFRAHLSSRMMVFQHRITGRARSR